MPPRKRTRLSPSITTSHPSPTPPSENRTLPDPAHADTARGDDETKSAASIDSAMLDEEEFPADSEEGNAATPSEWSPGDTKRTQYADGGYNSLKSFKGQIYSGMAIGGSHTWNYDQGTWHETKEEPDLWKIDFKTTKRRAKTAPKGSGAPVGTKYHWLIVAHQHVTKIDANTYETHLTGSKYKLAHKSVSSNTWSIPTVKAQRARELELLEDSKRRVQGLPPVLASEKVKVEKHEKGQQTLEALFTKFKGARDLSKRDGAKRKRDDEGNREGDSVSNAALGD